MMKDFFQIIVGKVLQYLVSVGGGLVLAFETSIPYFIPCFLSVLLDVFTAWLLARRVHKKYPDRADGKFKSEYKFRIMITMIVALLAVIVAHYVDVHVIKDTDISVRFVVGVFLFYQVWSILENWSSENDNKIAKALQRVMINKAERHFNTPLADIFFEDENDQVNG